MTRSLARVEARELVASPWFAAGVGFWIVLFGTIGFLFVEDVERSWWEFFALAPMMAIRSRGWRSWPPTATAPAAAAMDATSCSILPRRCRRPHPRASRSPRGSARSRAWSASPCSSRSCSQRNERIYGPIDGEALAAMLHVRCRSAPARSRWA